MVRLASVTLAALLCMAWQTPPASAQRWQGYLFGPQRDLDDPSGACGRATIALDGRRLVRGQEFTLDVKFESHGEHHYYNLFFHTLADRPATLALFDGNERYLGDLIKFVAGSFVGPSAGGSIRIPKDGYGGTQLSLMAGADPNAPYQPTLPPGKYYLQMIYHRIFLLECGSAIPDLKDPKKRELSAAAFRGRDLFRSNIIEFELVKNRDDAKAQAAAVATPLEDPTKAWLDQRIGKQRDLPGGSRSTIAVADSKIRIGEKLKVDVRFSTSFSDLVVFNPFYSSNEHASAELALFDAKGNFLDDLLEPDVEKGHVPPLGAWVSVGPGYVGSQLTFRAGTLPESDQTLPAGKYYLQMIYRRRFSLGAEWDRNGLTKRWLTAFLTKGEQPDSFRSNVVAIELTD